MTIAWTLAGLILLGGTMQAQTPPRVADLGHVLSADAPSWDGDRVYSRTATTTIPADGYATGRFTTDEHFGTHLDAPAHFSPSGWTVDRIPADRLVGPGVRLDVSDKVRGNEDYLVTVDDLKMLERSGRIGEGAILLVATGWDKRWPDAATYMNARNGTKHFPGLTPEAAAYAAGQWKVAGIVIDTPSVDFGPSINFAAHRATAPLNVWHVENAANLTTLPRDGYTIVVAPIKIEGGSGGPTRIFALVR